jgi:predicted transcriptional regulator of viral defense system
MEFFHTFGMPGRWYTRLFEAAADQNGFISTDDVRDLGGTTQLLVDMHRYGQLERVGHGLYRFSAFPASPRDELMQAALWPRGLGVISHDSALDLWELCDVNPARIHVTVPRAARIRRRTPSGYEIHVRDLAPADVTRLEGIRVVSPPRAILDGMERHLDDRLINQAIDVAHRRGLLLAREVTTLEKARR